MDFEICLVAFDKYYREQNYKKNGKFNKDVACEARRRLVQLKKILDNVNSLEAEYTVIIANKFDELSREQCARMIVIGSELQFFTEAFYYFAFRLRGILRSLPSLQQFECRGVRDVRNKLLEHPEAKDSEIFIESFGHGGKHGPVIKALRYDNQQDSWIDRGLYVNAKELFDNLYGEN